MVQFSCQNKGYKCLPVNVYQTLIVVMWKLIYAMCLL